MQLRTQPHSTARVAKSKLRATPASKRFTLSGRTPNQHDKTEPDARRRPGYFDSLYLRQCSIIIDLQASFRQPGSDLPTHRRDIWFFAHQLTNNMSAPSDK